MEKPKKRERRSLEILCFFGNLMQGVQGSLASRSRVPWLEERLLAITRIRIHSGEGGL